MRRDEQIKMKCKPACTHRTALFFILVASPRCVALLLRDVTQNDMAEASADWKFGKFLVVRFLFSFNFPWKSFFSHPVAAPPFVYDMKPIFSVFRFSPPRTWEKMKIVHGKNIRQSQHEKVSRDFYFFYDDGPRRRRRRRGKKWHEKSAHRTHVCLYTSGVGLLLCFLAFALLIWIWLKNFHPYAGVHYKQSRKSAFYSSARIFLACFCCFLNARWECWWGNRWLWSWWRRWVKFEIDRRLLW